MKTDDNRCRECGTKLHGKNAIDVGYCVSCYNMMMCGPDDDDDPDLNSCPRCNRSSNLVDVGDHWTHCNDCGFDFVG